MPEFCARLSACSLLLKSLRGVHDAERSPPCARSVDTWTRLPFLGCGLLLLLPSVDGLKSVLVSVWGLESVFGDRSVTAESSEAGESFTRPPPSPPR